MADKLGDRIYKLRKNLGISQEEFGIKLGVSRQTVSQWEANMSQPTVKNLQHLCSIFEVKMEYLLSQQDIEDYDGERAVLGALICADENIVDEEDVFPNRNDERVDKASKKADVCKQVVEKKGVKTSGSLIVALAMSITAILAGLFFVICGAISNGGKPKEGVFEVVRSTSYNFSMENIGWILLCVSLAFLAILGILLLCFNKKTKKK